MGSARSMGSNINDDMLIQATECGFYRDEHTPESYGFTNRWRSVLLLSIFVCGVTVTSAMTTVKLLPSIGALTSVRNGIAVANITAFDVTVLQKAHDKSLLEAIYCKGPLLDAVQRSKAFPEDSKHFVDMPIKSSSSPHTILAEFKTIIQPQLSSLHSSTERSLLVDFVSKHFDESGSDIQRTQLGDFLHGPNVPPRIASIQTPAYRDWAVALHKLWNELGRTPDPNVLSSYLRPTPVKALGESDKSVIVVPGGRFRESYYWDSYWIVEGLLVSHMYDTARHVVNNLLAYVAEHGFVPNGGRLYYLSRSQPPLLSDMVKLVAKDENGEWDMSYLAAAVPLLDKEYQYWMETHTANVTIGSTTYVLNEYTSDIGTPRPESYREDLAHAEGIEDKPMFYNDIIAAAESGWDFTSRWFRDHHSFPTITTMDIIPVDLNAILYRVEKNMMEMHRVLEQRETSQHYEEAAQRRLKAIDALMWDEETGSWRDYVKSTSSQSPVVSVANYLPLWAKAFDANDTTRLSKIVHSLRTSGLVQVAGVQTTTVETGEQWDAPVAWPPMQDMLIEGLFHAADATEANGDTAPRELAHKLIKTWVNSNFAAWNATGLMFEKYNATVVGGLGVGGEYVPQFGFGWSNGVILKFLTQYESLLNE